jgi:hypothetical protein
MYRFRDHPTEDYCNNRIGLHYWNNLERYNPPFTVLMIDPMKGNNRD